MFDLLNQVRVAELDEPVPMQSTGLTDKTGREIFEGDILDPCDGEDCTSVCWNATLAQWYVDYEGQLWEQLDVAYHGIVVGNIYENPELLGEQ